MIGNHWCTRLAENGERLCFSHVLVRQRQAVERLANIDRQNRERAAGMARVQAQVNAAHDQRVADVRAQNDAAFARQRPFLAALFAAAGEDGVVRAPPAPPPARAPDLQRLARDRQNVHTATVVRNTNAGEEKLLAVRTD